MKNRNARGFTLIELLIVVAIIGIIAAIAIPNLLNAIDRGKQKRTMSDMRSIGTAVESYAVDFNAYPGDTDINALEPHLEPVYIKEMPKLDGWKNELEYVGWNINSSGFALGYTVASKGKDGAAGPRTGGPTTGFNDDIVFVNGQFFQYPEGQQK
jgi:general secretion pathway protein G